MKKAFIFFLIFFSSFTINQNLLSKNKNTSDFKGCVNDLSKNYFLNYDKIPIKKIEIDTHNYRNWVTNNIKIITSNTRFIPNNLKKRFDATIKVIYSDNSYCIFSGRIRHHGDAKDHISLKGNSILQSLDINLDSGNIKGITKFKLFKPDVRGVLEDVVIQTQLLRDLGYLAPRSKKVLARVNETESVMLFQEKAAKELLEFNNRREGPIFEGDQKYFFKLVQDIPDNNLSNWSVGTPQLRNKTMKVMLAKSTNSRVVNKGEIQKEIYLKSLNNLNLIYLYWANRFQDEKNNYFFFDYDLDNELLGLFNKDNVIKLEIYNILMQATNSQHALGPDARKFYWNSFENYYEPINYDANPGIDQDIPTTTTVNFRLPVSIYYDQSFGILENNLKNIDLDELNKKITVYGLSFSKAELKAKIDKIILNLKNNKKNYLSNINEDILAHNKFRPIDNIFERFNKNLKDIDPNAFLIKYDRENNELNKCKLYFENCSRIELNQEQLTSLLEGELKLNKTNYQFVGENLDINNIKSATNYLNQIKIGNTSINYEPGINVTVDKENKKILINQVKAGAKVYIINGELKDYHIEYIGLDIIEEGNKQNLKIFPKNFPIDNVGLTGCLSLINLNIEKISIAATNSSCEDTVNFINSRGFIEDIKIYNSFSDALDVDFSNIKFNNITISNALNDCVDFSSGDYSIENLELDKCGDKGLSVGEKSLVKLNNIDVKFANIGVASKDSSVILLKKAKMSNLKTCVSAYNKKQEFLGGYIEMADMTCEKYYRIADLDNSSKILLKEKLLVNNIYGDFYNPLNLKISEVEGEEIFGHLIKDYDAVNKDGSVNAAVEIKSGIKEKWEISKTTGSLSREFYMGSPRIIHHTPYPVNYGMIPRTILPLNRGGDGDPLDIIILGESLPQGKIVKVKPLGVMKMTDSGEQDDKIIAVPIKSHLVKYNNLDHFKNEKPEVLQNIKEWFINYKGKNIVEFINFESDEEANFIIKDAARYYKRSGLKERS